MGARKLILASSSPFRRQLLARLGLPFDVMPPGIDESPRPGEPAIDLVVRLAVEKAEVVARAEPNALVIGSDQVAVHDGGRIVGKPRDHAHAVAQLTDASGKTVVLHTGIALVDSRTGRVQSDVVAYAVRFKVLTPAQIEGYLAREQPYACSGSLRADGLGIALLERFEGDDPTALIGLPLIRLVSMLEREGVSPVEDPAG